MAGSNLAKKPIIIEATRQQEIKLRVAAYCRVSTDSEDQLNSFVAQNTYYNAYIRNHENWTLVDVYADEGITGTSAKKRGDFQRLLNDCRKGKIDKVLVKSISRFARNTAECLETIRELKALGISVFFEEHNIDTKMIASEMMTAIIASCAQAESESISKNMRWSYQKRMERGTFLPGSVPYGYRIVEKNIAIDPDEAKIIKEVFERYLAGESKLRIAAELNGRNIVTRKGNQWDYCAIRYILRNVNYTGNSLWQKSYSTESFPTKKVRNYGERPKYYASETHPAIIGMDTFQAVQQLLAERGQFFRGKDGETLDVFAGMIFCGECGGKHRKKMVSGKEYWVCRTHENEPAVCTIKAIPAEEIREAFNRLYFKLKHNGDQIFQTMIRYSVKIRKGRMLWNEEYVELNRQISDISAQTHTLTLLNQQGLIHPDMYISQTNRLAEQLRTAKQKKEKLLGQEDDDLIVKTRWIMEALDNGPDFLDAFDGELFCELVERIIVESNTRIRFRLKNGLELQENIERTVR